MLLAAFALMMACRANEIMEPGSASLAKNNTGSAGGTGGAGGSGNAEGALGCAQQGRESEAIDVKIEPVDDVV